MPPSAQHVVFWSKAPVGSPRPSWEAALAERGFSILHVRSLDQARVYLKNYPLIALLLDLGEDIDLAMSDVTDLSACERASAAPLIGLTASPSVSLAQSRLAESGLSLLLPADAPAPFLIAQLEAHRAAALARNGHASGAKELATEARRLLHGLTQPMSALQGKLELLDARTPDQHPEKAALRDLIALAALACDRLVDLQELNRRHA